MEWNLRQWRETDAADVAAYADNKKIADNLRDAFPHPYTLSDAQEYLRQCLESGEERQYLRAITAEGRAVGSIGVFLGNDVYSRSAELGYWLAEDFWGQGIMTGAVRQICEEVFARYDVVRIYAEPFARNRGSRRVLEKAGFALEGILKNSVYKHGEILDSCIYALVK